MATNDHLVPVTATAVAMDLVKISKLVESFFAGRNERTLRAYRADLQTFCVFLNVETVDDAARHLLGHGHGDANGLALEFKNQLIEKGLAPATINRRLAAVRSLVRLARTLGLVPWSLEVKDVARQAYRDTKGPGTSGFVKLLEAARRPGNAKSSRDVAILRLLFDLALRREEVVSLDVQHLDLDSGTVEVLGKGKTQRQRLTLPEPTTMALKAWLVSRGDQDRPLFTNFDRAGKGRRLTGRAVHYLVKRLGQEAGIEARPHGLRHASISHALDLTNGDVRAVQRFSRHADLKTVLVYDDCRRDLGGDVAKMVATSVEVRSGRE